MAQNSKWPPATAFITTATALAWLWPLLSSSPTVPPAPLSWPHWPPLFLSQRPLRPGSCCSFCPEPVSLPLRVQVPHVAHQWACSPSMWPPVPPSYFSLPGTVHLVTCPLPNGASWRVGQGCEHLPHWARVGGGIQGMGRGQGRWPLHFSSPLEQVELPRGR